MGAPTVNDVKGTFLKSLDFNNILNNYQTEKKQLISLPVITRCSLLVVFFSFFGGGVWKFTENQNQRSVEGFGG